MRSMNWRRGLFRLWLALSLCWLVWAGLSAWQQEQTRQSRDRALHFCFSKQEAAGGNIIDCFGDETIYPPGAPPLDNTATAFGKYAAYALLPPLIVLAFGLLGTWVISGFGPKDTGVRQVR
jgi:hypothetical protein